MTLTLRLLLVSTFLIVPAVTATQAPDPQLPAPALNPQTPQGATDDVPAHIAVVDGTATLERDAVAQAAQVNVALLAGDRLRTDRGRVEVLFGDGSALDIDENSAVDLVSDSLMRLRAGRVRLSVARGPDPIDYRVDAAAASVLIRASGEYRLALSDARASDPAVDLSVTLGSAELSNALGSTVVRAGMHAVASSRVEPSQPSVSYAATGDTFDRWSDDQRAARLSTGSAPYLPADLQPYGGSLDRNGSWAYEPDYGNVWYPRVASTWEPYSDGSWSYVGSFGWTWVGLDAWSWPTHHYGRWGLRGSRWFWMPDRDWGPAWVSWATAPGYVSWCPLGRDNRAVFDLGFGIGARGFDSRFGWHVMPSRAFVPNVIVPRYTVARPTLAPAVWSQFSRRDAGPSWRAPNNAVPLRSPHVTSGRAFSRGVSSSQPTRAMARRDSSAPAARTPFDAARGRSVTGTPGWRVDNQGPGAGYRQRTPESLTPARPQTGNGGAPRATYSYSPRQPTADRRSAVQDTRPAYTPRPPSVTPRTDYRSAPRKLSGGGRSAIRSAPPAASPRSSSSPSSHSSGGGGRSGSSSGGSGRGNSSRRGGGR